ncbi:hypothetical protein SK128_022057, partial [Halocaridina rubra]
MIFEMIGRIVSILLVAAMAWGQRGPQGERRQQLPAHIEELEPKEVDCPPNWVTYKSSCLKFIRSPVKNRIDARKQCQ